jgi:hypothetical protein
MVGTNALAKLRAEYKQIANQDPNTWTEDERISVIYYRADIAAGGDALGTAIPHTVRQWTANMRALDAYFANYNAFPRAAQLQLTPADPPELRHLITWVETQRRAVRAGRRCSYQRRRLETVSGYVERSHDGHWLAQFEGYRQFIDTHPGVPNYRSKDANERSLANWAAKQRAAAKTGTLPGDRAERLRTLRIWT